MNAVIKAAFARGWEKDTADFHCLLRKREDFLVEKLVTFVRKVATTK